MRYELVKVLGWAVLFSIMGLAHVRHVIDTTYHRNRIRSICS